jgi:hypothetical protein
MLLREFQEDLENIHMWNSKIIENEHKRFMKAGNCDWMDDLIQAAFVEMCDNVVKEHNLSADFVKIEHPKGCDFIHTCYINIARELWKKPQLMYHEFSPVEKLRNRETFTQMIEKVITDTLKSLMPMKEMLADYLLQDGGSTKNEIDSEESYEPADSKELYEADSKESYEPVDSKESYEPVDSKESYEAVVDSKESNQADSKESYEIESCEPDSKESYEADSKESYEAVESKESYEAVESKESYEAVDSKESYEAVESKESYEAVESKESYEAVDSKESYEADSKESYEADSKESYEADSKESNEAVDSKESYEAVESKESYEADSKESYEADSKESYEADSKESYEAAVVDANVEKPINDIADDNDSIDSFVIVEELKPVEEEEDVKVINTDEESVEDRNSSGYESDEEKYRIKTLIGVEEEKPEVRNVFIQSKKSKNQEKVASILGSGVSYNDFKDKQKRAKLKKYLLLQNSYV